MIRTPAKIENRAFKLQQFAELREKVGRIITGGTERKAMTPARKRLIWEAHDGVCFGCGDPVPMTGAGVIYDHSIPLANNGPETNEAVAPLCRDCDRIKTRLDRKDIAKAKRLAKVETEGRETAKRPIRSRGFSELSRGFDGVVRPRKARVAQV